MSKLDDLINELCPDGVEYKKIEDFIDYIQPGKYIVESTKYDDSFETPVLTAGQTFILGYTDETDGIFKASKENPVIIFDDFTAGFHWVDFDFKVKSSAMKILISKNNINFRYFFHVMGKLNIHSTEHTRLWIGTYSQFEIPVPPLEIQNEIVRILDNFTELEEELEEELEARRKQYEYYRDSLLTFDDSVEWKFLSEVTKYSDTRIKNSELKPYTYVSVENLLQQKKGVEFTTKIPEGNNSIQYLKNDILIGNIRPYLRKIWLADREGGTNGDVLTIRILDEYKNKIIPEYLFYILSSEDFFNYDIQYSKGAKMPRGSKDDVMKYKFAIPSIDDQKRIISILERFDCYCNDITSGLPAEIEARHKQYEYYRDKLLTFKRKDEK